MPDLSRSTAPRFRWISWKINCSGIAAERLPERTGTSPESSCTPAPATQAKLLRAIEQKEVMPVGASEPVLVEARVLAATNKNLVKEMEEGRFREDLYYRLNVV